MKVLQRLAYEQAATLDDNVDGRSEGGGLILPSSTLSLVCGEPVVWVTLSV